MVERVLCYMDNSRTHLPILKPCIISNKKVSAEKVALVQVITCTQLLKNKLEKTWANFQF